MKYPGLSRTNRIPADRMFVLPGVIPFLLALLLVLLIAYRAVAN